jgi:cytochrome P450
MRSLPPPPFDPANPAHAADPIERLAEARRRCPVSEPQPGLFVLAADADVRAALMDPARFSSRGNFALDGERPELPVPAITMTDPPEHTALRARLRRWFTPARQRQQEPAVRAVVKHVLDGLPGTGVLDLYQAFVAKVPARVLFAFLGLPTGDWGQELGGVAGEPRPVPGMGWFTTCQDPQGNEFALWQDDPAAPGPAY